MVVDDARYFRTVAENGEEVFLFDRHRQRQQEQTKVRAAGESLDERMEALMRDAPPAARPNQERRRRR